MFHTMLSVQRLSAAAGVCLVLSGCVKRKETITVHDDGSMALSIEMEGDRADVETGAPTLVKADGWEFSHKLEIDKDGKETLKLSASSTIAAGQPIPDAYPTNDKDQPTLAVRHPTTLTVDRRADGTYYHFRRVYHARRWANVNYWRHKLIEEPLERSDEKSVEEMSDEKKQELVQNLIQFEALKQLSFARTAADALQPPLPQDVWLAACQAVRDAADAIDKKELLARLEREDEDHAKTGADDARVTGDDQPADGESKAAEKPDPAGEELTRLGRQYQEKIGDALRQAFQSKRIAQDTWDKFQKAYDTEMRRFAMTEDYGDEEWEVVVTMPGVLVGHNGDKVEGHAVTFGFEGQALFDRDVELLVTSVVR
ncbi:MAG: hypothetical protein HOP29_17685 [Phycisphaerales bacterium]|nr:hypothetical protein [Phycisphaerales bacterium]